MAGISTVMVDTSVWIDYFRGRPGPATDLLDSLLSAGDVAICGPVEMEIIRGVCPAERKRVASLLAQMSFAEVTRADFVAAGESLNALRSKGITLPAIDALMAAIARRCGLPILTTDEHFQHLKGIRLLP